MKLYCPKCLEYKKMVPYDYTLCAVCNQRYGKKLRSAPRIQSR